MIFVQVKFRKKTCFFNFIMYISTAHLLQAVYFLKSKSYWYSLHNYSMLWNFKQKVKKALIRTTKTSNMSLIHCLNRIIFGLMSNVIRCYLFVCSVSDGRGPGMGGQDRPSLPHGHLDRRIQLPSTGPLSRHLQQNWKDRERNDYFVVR